MSENPSGDRPSDPQLPDGVRERFPRDTERDIRGTAPKEPSARERTVTERLRRQDVSSPR